jgi:hypothetical protein
MHLSRGNPEDARASVLHLDGEISLDFRRCEENEPAGGDTENH